MVAFTTGGSPFALAVADLNGDDRPDLAAANSGTASVAVLLNRTARGASTPAFAARVTVAVGGLPYALAPQDLNGDGRPDLITANHLDDNASVLLNTTWAGATLPIFAAKIDLSTGPGPDDVVVADLNGDSLPDLALANSNGDSVSILGNQGPRARLAAIGGTPQHTPADRPFARPLRVRAADGCGGALPGLRLTFQAPASGPSALLGTAAAVTGADGQVGVPARANGLLGSYIVSAAIKDTAATAPFELSNDWVNYLPLAIRSLP